MMDTAVSHDRTEDRARLSVLAEASHAFATAVTDYRVLLGNVARTSADLVGDGCLVTLIADDGESLFNAASAHRDPTLESDYKRYLDGLGISTEFLGIGVERIDYTKGLPERFLALQRFFERYPAYRERLVFVQLAAPSRSRIKRYQELQQEIEDTLDRVNRAVGTRSWRPIVYRKGHHDRQAIWPFYRHADFCMVTSLHDGMNLVAKEFVSVRDDGDGVLILSRFTGGARELRDALLVNPYDLDETAVETPPEERAARMTRMRQVISEHNIYRWAGLLLSELARMPTEPVGAGSP